MDLRQKILTAVDGLVKVPVPEWGVDVWLRRLRLKEKLQYEELVTEIDNAEKKNDRTKRNEITIRYVIEYALDEMGQKIFSPEDAEILADKGATALERILLTGFRINSVRTEELVALGNVSSETRNGASPSVSAGISEG